MFWCCRPGYIDWHDAGHERFIPGTKGEENGLKYRGVILIKRERLLLFHPESGIVSGSTPRFARTGILRYRNAPENIPEEPEGGNPEPERPDVI
jgi:hypothetical protein